MLCRACPGRLAQYPSGAARASIARRQLSHKTKSPLNINEILRSSSFESKSSESQEVEVVGHIRTIRNQKRISFLELGDGSTMRGLQAILQPDQAMGLGTGTAVKVTGLWQQSPNGTKQAHELHAREVRVLGEADASTYPLQKKYHSPEFLRTIPHLRLRTPFNALIARLRSECEFQLSTYFRNDGFVRVHPPIITGTDSEGAGETLGIALLRSELGSERDPSDNSGYQEFFRGPRHLSVSSQLHLEAYVHEHPRVWTLSPTFRAEKSDTPRHLSEFYMLEAELRTDSLSEVLDHVEALIRDLATGLNGSQVVEELLVATRSEGSSGGNPGDTRAQMVARRWEGLRKQYWPRITYNDAMKLLQAEFDSADGKFKFAPRWESGIQLEHERYLAAEVGQGSPVFVTDYPRIIKPFYMLPTRTALCPTGDKDTVASFDLLLPDVCEVVGGSLREHRADALEKVMKQQGFLQDPSEDAQSTQDLSWYLDLRRYGSVPHGGYGLGFDRLISYLAGVDNIRDVVPWPRYYGRCDG